MNFQVIQVLQPEEVHGLVSAISGLRFVDGKLTASGLARDVKHNLQAERGSAETERLEQTILAALKRNEVFQSFAFPKRVARPLFSRYEPGMQYGAHIDHAVMGGADPMRTDLATTVFLSDASSYDGGELVLEMPLGEQEIKLDAGEAIVYPATTLHRVAPVTRGVRLAAVTWVQSAVPDERLRAILFDLSAAMQTPGVDANAPLSTLLTKAYHNLLRVSIDL